jgi:adenine-specific DNA-methyltransferase
MLQKEQIKHTGATFTPFNLAEYLARKLLKYINNSGKIKVLDPACGEGELLISMGKILSENKYDYSLTQLVTHEA